MNNREAVARTAARPFNWLGFLSRYGTVISLVVLIGVFSVSSPEVFASPLNLANVLNQVAVLGIISLGLTTSMVVGLFDLSVGSMATFGGYFVARLLMEFPEGSAGIVVVAIIAVLVASMLIGMINGALVAYLGVTPIVETLAMAFVVTGVLLGVSGGQTVNASEIPKAFQAIGQGEIWGIPNPVLIFALTAVALWVVLEQTQLGRNMYAVGGNREAARLCGVLFPKHALVAMGISATCAALGGLVAAATLGAGSPQGSGTVYLLNAFVTAFIGASTLKPGKFHVLGTVIGVLLIGVIDNGLSILGVATFWQYIAEGTILILALISASVNSTLRT